jgi:hypothetical protein
MVKASVEARKLSLSYSRLIVYRNVMDLQIHSAGFDGNLWLYGKTAGRNPHLLQMAFLYAIQPGGVITGLEAIDMPHYSLEKRVPKLVEAWYVVTARSSGTVDYVTGFQSFGHAWYGVCRIGAVSVDEDYAVPASMSYACFHGLPLAAVPSVSYDSTAKSGGNTRGGITRPIIHHQYLALAID